MLPKQLAGFGVNGIKNPLAGSDKDRAIGQERRREDRRAGFKGPDFPARAKIERVHLAVIGADKNVSAANDRRRFDRPAGFETPEQGGLIGHRAAGHAGQGRVAAKHRPLARAGGLG